MSGQSCGVTLAILLLLAPFQNVPASPESPKYLPPLSIPVVIEKAPAAPALHDVMPLQALKTNSLSYFDYQQLRLGQPMGLNLARLNPESDGQISVRQSHALEKRIVIRQSVDRYDLHTSYRLIAHKQAPNQIDELEITHFSSSLPRDLLRQKLQHALTNKYGHPLSFEQLKALHLEGLSRELQAKQRKLALLEQQAEHNAALKLFVQRQQWRIQNSEQRITHARQANELSAEALCRSLQVNGSHCHLRGTARPDSDGLLISGQQSCRIWLRHDREMLSLCQAAGAMVVRITSPAVSRWNQLQAHARLQQLEFRL